MKKCGLLLLLLAAFNGFAQDRSIPRARGHMNDFAGVVSAAWEEKIETLGLELKQKAGAELAVVTVQELGGETIESYAVRLFETWGIGDSSEDNGILLILAMQERRVRVEVGYGLEAIVTDLTSGEILDYYVLPQFRENAYGKGLFQGAAMIAGLIARDAGVEITGSLDYNQSRRESEKEGGGGIFFIILMVFLIIVTRGRIIPWMLLGMLSGGGGGRGGFGGGNFGGGFGGFGGGMSGGGGASRSF